MPFFRRQDGSTSPLAQFVSHPELGSSGSGVCVGGSGQCCFWFALAGSCWHLIGTQSWYSGGESSADIPRVLVITELFIKVRLRLEVLLLESYFIF